jgi:hypothetical protein
MKIERLIKKQKSRNLILLLFDSEFITPARTGRDLSLLLCAEFFIANGHIETCPCKIFLLPCVKAIVELKNSTITIQFDDLLL